MLREEEEEEAESTETETEEHMGPLMTVPPVYIQERAVDPSADSKDSRARALYYIEWFHRQLKEGNWTLVIQQQADRILNTVVSGAQKGTWEITDEMKIVTVRLHILVGMGAYVLTDCGWKVGEKRVISYWVKILYMHFNRLRRMVLWTPTWKWPEQEHWKYKCVISGIQSLTLMLRIIYAKIRSRSTAPLPEVLKNAPNLLPFYKITSDLTVNPVRGKLQWMKLLRTILNAEIINAWIGGSLHINMAKIKWQNFPQELSMKKTIMTAYGYRESVTEWKQHNISLSGDINFTQRI